MSNSSQELDTALKAVCEDLIAKAGVMIAAPLLSFTTQARKMLLQPSSDSKARELPTQEFAGADRVQELYNSFMSPEGGLETGFIDLLKKLNLWLSDKRTISVLVTPILVCFPSSKKFTFLRSYTGRSRRSIFRVLQPGQERV